jgi:hypothetical protein
VDEQMANEAITQAESAFGPPAPGSTNLGLLPIYFMSPAVTESGKPVSPGFAQTDLTVTVGSDRAVNLDQGGYYCGDKDV